jgi:hypothetical protein
LIAAQALNEVNTLANRQGYLLVNTAHGLGIRGNARWTSSAEAGSSTGLIGEAGHAWSGGSSNGTHTDPQDQCVARNCQILQEKVD